MTDSQLQLLEQGGVTRGSRCFLGPAIGPLLRSLYVLGSERNLLQLLPMRHPRASTFLWFLLCCDRKMPFVFWFPLRGQPSPH